MRWLRLSLLAGCLMVAAAPASAYVPQTVVFTGQISDFDPQNQIADDRNDTQTFCTPAALPLDLGRIYITNDASFLYIGIEQNRACFGEINLGVAIHHPTLTGGTSDPFGRKIGWSSVTSPAGAMPAFVLYDVIPTQSNPFNYEVLYKWNSGTSAWVNISTQVNPSWGTGSNGLGIVDSASFKEIKLPLSVLVVSAGAQIDVEWWLTQEGAQKGPLDAVCGNAVQMSRVGQTTFDTTAVVQMPCMLPYTLLAVNDVDPPTVSTALAVNFPLNANKEFSLGTNKIDVAFSEPVQNPSAQTTTNYALSGPGGLPPIISALRDASALNVVHLTLGSTISANASFYNVTVTNVMDLAGNPIVNNGSTNVRSFFIKNVRFEGDVRLELCKSIFAPADTFSVEGNLLPLNFSGCDNAYMTDGNGDSVYVTTVPFCLPKDPGSGVAEAELLWKLGRGCVSPPFEFEPLSGNRSSMLSSTAGALDTLRVTWNNNTPANFTSKPMDVIFQINAAAAGIPPDSAVWLMGSEYPLSFTPGQGTMMKDDGVSPDATAGDKIYTVKVRFPICASKNVTWKVHSLGAFECSGGGQGDRNVYLNDAVFDTVGGPGGPITLPARGYNRCTVTDKAVAMVFRVDMAPTYHPGPADSVYVGIDPGTFDPAVTPQYRLLDGGVSPDLTAGDWIFSRTVTFPDSFPLFHGFKYWYNSQFECPSIGDRTFTIDDVNYSVGNPQVHPTGAWNYCTDPSAVPDGRPGGAIAAFAVLRPSFPNPMSPRTTIRFELRRPGRATLQVFDVSGRRVATLVNGDLQAGPHEAVWEGRDESGLRVKSGVYLYELRMGGQRLSRRLVLVD